MGEEEGEIKKALKIKRYLRISIYSYFSATGFELGKNNPKY
jgi:hypothetical protein